MLKRSSDGRKGVNPENFSSWFDFLFFHEITKITIWGRKELTDGNIFGLIFLNSFSRKKLCSRPRVKNSNFYWQFWQSLSWKKEVFLPADLRKKTFLRWISRTRDFGDPTPRENLISNGCIWLNLCPNNHDKMLDKIEFEFNRWHERSSQADGWARKSKIKVGH